MTALKQSLIFTPLLLAGLLCLGGGQAYAQEGSTALENYFTPSTPEASSPDEDGFIRRWLLLEPISKPNRSNTVFTDSYVVENLCPESYPGKFGSVPKRGSRTKVDGKKLAWHAFDSKLFNIKLFRFASNLKTDVYGVIFWAVTIVDCPEEMEGVRMAVGSNSASRWWLNGEEAVLLSGDRRMVMDDCVSKRLTLKKGRNIICGAVINGPGMSDFCLRFIDSDGKPVTNIKISYE